MDTSSQGIDLIDKVVAELDYARENTAFQMQYILDICEKSNSVLLRIEASQNTQPIQDPSATTRYKFCKDTLCALVKAVESFEKIMNIDSPRSPGNFESFSSLTKVKTDYIGSAVRKMLVLNDAITDVESELTSEESVASEDNADVCSTDMETSVTSE